MRNIKIGAKYAQQDYDKLSLVSFLNLYTIGRVLEIDDNLDPIQFYADGLSMAWLLRVLTGRSVRRASFDFTSVASEVLVAAELQGTTVFFVGSTLRNLEMFIEKIKQYHPRLNVVGCSHGYVPIEQWCALAKNIVESNADLLVVGMGGGRQEQFLLDVRNNGYQGKAFTCGGFIHQTATAKGYDYYPKYINKYNLRALYRMRKEPTTLRRYLVDYPLNCIRIIYLVLTRRMRFDVL